MAEHAVALGLKSVPLVAEHYDKVYDPLKDKTKQGFRKVKEMRDKRNGDYESESDEYDYDGPPARRSTTGGSRRNPRDFDRQRPSSRYDDVDDDGFVVEEKRYAKGPPRARSVGRDGRGDRRGGSRRDYSDSESSISPRPRRERRKSLGERALVALGLGGAAGAAASEKSSKARPRSRRERSISSDYSARRGDRSYGPPRSSRGYPDEDDRTPSRYKPRSYAGDGSEPGGQITRRNNNNEVGSRAAGSEKGGEGKKKKGSSSSESSSDLCSSSEDERRTRKMKGKEYVTAGLAAVATIHAAHSVYSSMEARDKRHAEVAAGDISPEQARKQRNKARLQDAAAIGIAALGIKGAYSEWQEVQEHRQELAEQNKSRQERHEKRVQRGVGKYAGQSQSGDGRSKSEGPRRRDRDRDRDY